MGHLFQSRGRGEEKSVDTEMVAPSLKSFYKISGKSLEVCIRFEFKVGANFEVGTHFDVGFSFKVSTSKVCNWFKVISHFIGADFKSVQSIKLVPALR